MTSLERKLRELLPEDRVKTRLIDRYAYASDASHFYLVPRAVLQPVSIEEVIRIFEFSHRERIHITFRAGGTSLSGQGVTDGILVDLSNYWRTILPENDGATVRVGPAAIGGQVNMVLRKYGRKIGPDPASISAAMMGGILSNNSSGMCCGVALNSYHTLKHMTFALPNGQVFNTGRPEDYARFEKEAAGIAQELLALKKEIRDNPALVEKIRKKYRQKNTVGYCMNAFLDFDHPLDILVHLIIGGEGTLAFIAEAVLNTVPDLPYKITGMLYFENPEMACRSIYDLKGTGAEALEFMDRASLKSVEDIPGVPALLKGLPPAASAILCEFQENTPERLLEKYEQARPVFDRLPLLFQPNFTQDAKEQAIMWKIRKGMYPSVAGMRARGTSALMEDFTFPVERLGEAVVDVQRLFEKYDYKNGIIFGHAKDGNLHFVISQSYFSKEDIDHYERFNDDLFDLVLDKYDGALKGEHSSGRAVSAYVEREWGPEAYSVMKRLKRLLDPDNLLNPGIVIAEDPLLHVHHLKWMPVVEEEVDRCIECGFCEHTCPSRDITLTPRRRIGIRRALKRLDHQGDKAAVKAILNDFQYDGLETCAVDGMCATNCPVNINTGDLVKRLRRENHSSFANRLALFAAKNFRLVEKIARLGIRSGLMMNKLFGRQFMRKTTAGLKKIIPVMPLWSNQVRPPARLRLARANGNGRRQVIYFSTCISRMMGGDLVDTLLSVAIKAGVEVIIPEESGGLCCGQVFSSKGFQPAYQLTANRAIERLWKTSKEGKIPVVTDTTSCTMTLKTSRSYLTEENQQRFDRLTILDVIEYAAEIVLPQLPVTKKKTSVVFHPVCSVHKMDTMSKLQAIGKACAEHAHVPLFAKCCGMAGDRGFYFPELTASATRVEAGDVNQGRYEGYYSSSTTCEMAMSDAVGKQYASVLKLLDEVSG